MTGTAFQSALIRAGAYGVRATTSQPVRNEAEALAFVQAQIAGTVLPRVLTFRCDGASLLTCSASGRRLISLETGQDGPLMASAENMDPALQWLRRVITQACTMPVVLDVQARPLRPAPPPGHPGISAREMARAMELRAGGATVADRLAKFVDLAGSAIQAAARIHNDMLYPMKGPEAALDRLGDAVDSLLEKLDALHESLAPSQQTPALMLFDHGATQAGFCAVFDGPQILFAETRAGAEAHLAHVWDELAG